MKILKSMLMLVFMSGCGHSFFGGEVTGGYYSVMTNSGVELTCANVSWGDDGKECWCDISSVTQHIFFPLEGRSFIRAPSEKCEENAKKLSKTEFQQSPSDYASTEEL